ncbi:MAG TPA: epimerase [Verrucomicrobiales bacterium]|nr:epimerase [Verrucomicrobiales bacterium]
MKQKPPLPDVIRSEDELLDQLTRPSAALIEFILTLSGPLVVLGAGGKMGPTLCGLAKRATEEAGHPLEIIAVSRFSDAGAQQWLAARGITTVRADLLDRAAVMALPDAPDVINLTGLKFGTGRNPALTWATNTLGPALVAERYAASRIVALSTGNVYPLVPVAEGGAREEQPLTPLGEYANAAVARERIFHYFSQRNATPIALIRLNFAVELRYGVLVDIARRIWEERPIRLSNGSFNCIWQGDANEIILRSLPLATSPADAWNLSSPKPFSVREVAGQFGERLGKPPIFEGTEAPDSFICNPAKLCARLGPPATPVSRVIDWIAQWIRNNGVLWEKSTSFEVRDGGY